MSVSPESWAYRQRNRYRWLRYFLRDVLLRPLGFNLLVKPHVEGLENIPHSGPTILMMNHSFTVDGVVVIGVIKSRFVVPMLKVENLHHPVLGIFTRSWGAYGVERGKIDRVALKKTFDLLALGELVLVAPEGTRHHELQRPKDGLAYIAMKANPVIVPTALWNGETWYSDLLRPRRTHVQVRFGKPFRLKGAGQRVKRDALPAIADEMMYQLAELLPEAYRGVYSDMTQKSEHYLNLDL